MTDEKLVPWKRQRQLLLGGYRKDIWQPNFPASSLNIASKHLMLTAIQRTEARGPRITVKLNCGERSAACHQAKRSAKSGCESRYKIMPSSLSKKLVTKTHTHKKKRQ